MIVLEVWVGGWVWSPAGALPQARTHTSRQQRRAGTHLDTLVPLLGATPLPPGPAAPAMPAAAAAA